ncbi:murein DD-endopeptidase MepM/ murein hydrolase activator NlpD [Streptomyces sp. V4I23]|uniref:M23 family metallopeptidase n=1 Tax=Streptomyces sp. V4I23 TaxID=3042282 RepID=UPI00277DD4E9|nr:M23 family metallopeptidase [Streptomyces sp. V4I23]MDQ1007862.1 murein DD-endopeptidase MepM/ murein hydrolase activator NlpD [Streptomyces sp. V4I23]
MAFTRATGKHRAPSRLTRRSRNIAGVATLATTGVIGSLASPALAADAEPSVEDTGLTQIVSMGSIADEIADQAAAQKQEAAEAAAKARAKAKAEAEAKRKAEARAKEAREAKERAAREAERRRLNSFRLPVAGSFVTTGYQAGGSLWSSGSHSGVDFRAASGTSVVAVGAGTVVEAGWGGAYGNNIVLRMNDGTYTQYGHLSSINVSVGQRVMPGQQIGLAGSTGNSTGPHLHFEARTSPEYGSDMNPIAYLRARGVSV